MSKFRYGAPDKWCDGKSTQEQLIGGFGAEISRVVKGYCVRDTCPYCHEWFAIKKPLEEHMKLCGELHVEADLHSRDLKEF